MHSKERAKLMIPNMGMENGRKDTIAFINKGKVFA
jgi:hypothetical protein